MDATCAIQASIHVFSLVRKYVSRILGTYQYGSPGFLSGIVLEGMWFYSVLCLRLDNFQLLTM